MKKDKTDSGDFIPAILAGIFLLIFDFPLILLTMLMIINGGIEDTVETLSLCLFVSVIVAAAVFLILRNSKLTAILISVATVFILVFFLSETIATLHEYISDSSHMFIPWFFILYPLGEILAWMLLSISLFFRGWRALILTLLSATMALISCLIDHFRFYYFDINGHPSPLNGLPVIFAVATVCIGLWRRSISPKTKILQEEP